MLSGSIPVDFVTRRVPLAPAAAVARDGAALALARALLRRPLALAALTGVAGRSVLAVLGPEEHLPWVDGVVYLGSDPRAPALLMPTTVEPSVHPVLLERALGRRVQRPGRVAVVPRWGLVLPLSHAGRISGERLAAHFEVEAAP